MSPAPRRRTRATGFSPGGPRELTDAPRRQARGGRRATAARKAAPAEKSRTVDPIDLDKVESKSGADECGSPRRGRGQTRSPRPRTRSSSPLDPTRLPDNHRTRSPLRDADAARAPRRRLGRGLGKHARGEDTLEKVGGPAEETGGEFSGSSVARPAKKLRAGDRGGEAIRRQMEQEKRLLATPPAALAVMTPSRVGASVLRAGVSALRYLGFRKESPRPVAEGNGGASPANLEVSSHEAPGSTAESSSEQEVVKSTDDGPTKPDGGALASAVLHERTGEDLIQEHRRAVELKKILKLGRRNIVPLKAPSECGSDDDEAAKAAYRFTEELRPVSLPNYDASTRYIGWHEGDRGMLVVEEGSDDLKEERKGKPLQTALEWFNDNSDTVPTPDELVGVLGKYRFDQLSSTTGRTYRAPSPSDPYEDFEYESDTGEPIDRYDGHPLPPPRSARRRKITARSAPDFSGLADAHLPISYKGLPYNQLPPEWQNHKESWKIRQRDEIAMAQLADRKARGVDEDDYQSGIRAHAAQETKRRLREARLLAAGKAENDRRRARELELEKLALKAAAEERLARASKAAGEPSGTPTRVRRPSVARAPRCPTITEETEEPSPVAPAAVAAAAATAPVPAAARPGGKKPRVFPAEWAGLPINPRTHLPEGMVGLVYGVNYFSDSDDYSDEGESPTTPPPTTNTPATNVVVSGVDVDVSALVDSIPSHELKALFVSPDVDAADVDIASIVDSISRDDIEALLGIPPPSASDSREFDTAANFAISDEVMAMVEAIPDGDFDEMMGGIIAVSS
ncbi:hypothetical protein VE03_04832 [Pseudogymnoascus sp. 23342-1-I1]|nr:hypothetical protein VE03_04832 [Pseudogymnoascus sp. 23342-1-I1]